VKRVLIPFAAFGLVAALFAGGGSLVPSAAATAPPPPPMLATASPSPLPSATPTEIPGVESLFPATPKPHGSPSPPPPRRVGIEGVWELAIQQGANTTYTHLKLRQKQDTLTGTYLDARNKPSPAFGTVDGSQVRIVVSLADGSTIVFEAQLDGTTDMVGMMTTPTQQIPFTADYRPKENFFDNLNENPTGLTNGLTTPPPR
jgi:hypothetical protein